MTHRTITSLAFASTALFFLATTGCGTDPAPSSEPGDGPDASFSIGKADGPAGGYSACQLREVLEVVNESTSTVERLNDEAGLHLRAAKGVFAHRIGEDGISGTGDDDIFDDLKELDDVPYVGPVALKQLSDYVTVRCYPDLEARPIITDKTWSGYTGGGWARDSLEIEATMTVTGMTGQALRALMKEEDANGKTGFAKVRRHKTMEGFSFDYPLDEIPWNSTGHNLREGFEYVSLSIESGRFDIDADEGKRELSLGTDINDDTYYDTIDYDLLASGVQIRGRARWDGIDTVRRLLIAAKFDSEIDEEGLKRAGKIDVRTEGAAHLATLDNDVRSGKVSWSGGPTPVAPIKAAYDALDNNGLLPDIGDLHKVLVLDPKFHVRSLRSRYHLEETELGSLKRVYDNGLERVRLTNEFAQTALDTGRIEDADRPEVEALIAEGEALIEGTSIRQLAEAELLSVDPSVDLSAVVMPGDLNSNRPQNQLELDEQEIVARAAKEAFDRYAADLDDLDRKLTGTSGLKGSKNADMYVDWQRSFGGSLQAKRIVAPFIEVYRGQDTDANRAAALEAFNTYGAEQLAAGNDDFDKFKTLDETLWANLGQHLEYERLRITKRMIEAAGTVAKSMWFDNAREFYVPASRRVTSNFVIDTTDFSEMITDEEWQGMSDDARKPANTIPGDKVFHSTFVNEVQLELTEVKDYIARIDELKALIEGGHDTPENQRLLEGARFVFKAYQDAMRDVATAKKSEIIDRLEDRGATGDLDWEPAAASKGKTGLLILTDKI